MARRPHPSPEPDWMLILQIGIIASLGFWIFAPVVNGGWIGDDGLYITKNPLMHDPARVWKAWFQPGSFIEYYPVEQTAQWLQFQLFGLDTTGYHLTNIVLHIVSALLVWRLLARLGLKWAWLGGLLFVVHPMLVESVSLINEFKTVLALPPFILALHATVDYVDHGHRRDYLLALGFFTVAMLCKIIMAPFPFVFLLYIWWKRGKITWPDLRASIPFFAIAFALGMMTQMCGLWWSGGSQLALDRAVNGTPIAPLARLGLGGLTLAVYISRTFWPFIPMPVYPLWKITPPYPELFVPWIVVLGGFVWFWVKRKTWGRHALLALGFFTVMLLPFLGLHWISYMNFTWILEHFLYLPILALIALIVAALQRLDTLLTAPGQWPLRGFIALVVAAFAIQSHAYSGVFLSEKADCLYTIEHNPDCWLARHNLAACYQDENRFDDAIFQLRKALEEQPQYSHAADKLGTLYFNLGDTANALIEFKYATDVQPENAEARWHYGMALVQAGRTDEAVEQLTRAVHDASYMAEAHLYLGIALQISGKLPQAMPEYRAAAQLAPDMPLAHNNLGNALLKSGDTAGAIEQLNLALQLNPNDPLAHFNMGNALAQAGRTGEAVAHYESALQLNPNFTPAREKLATLQGHP